MNVRLALDVRLDGFPAPVGRLEAFDNGGIGFRYHEDHLATGRAISLSLPLDDAPIGDAATRAFFDNLLPENDQMQQVIDREGLDRSDLVGILAHVGADCAGAISCLPVGAPPVKVPGDLARDYRPLEDDEIALIATRLADREPLPDEVDDPSPVAGVQRKIALTLLPDGRFALPAAQLKVPTTHILKVPRRVRAAEALQEAAAGRLAQACGFEVANAEHSVIGGVDTLLLERFDRVVVDGRVYRLHQEDFAQALGLPARLKYQRYGREGRRFDAAAIRALLDRLSRPAQAIETFLLATIFNLAIGNNDNHAKNHAILYTPDGEAILAPLYDLLPVGLHEGYTSALAFDIGTAAEFDQMTREDLATFFASFGLEGARLGRFIAGAMRDLLETLEKRAVQLRALNMRNFDDLIGRELGRLAELLGLDMDIRERDYVGRGGGWLGVS